MLVVQYLFWANTLILVPVCFGTLLKASVTDQGAFAESTGWRTLVGSLWIAILACSILGIFWPASFVWLLVLQVIYKSVWLLTYVVPRLVNARYAEIPAGITSAFLFIVLVWPWFIPWRQIIAAP